MTLDGDFVKRVFPAMAERMVSKGLTGFVDPGVLLMGEAEACSALIELDNESPLPFRLRGSHYALPAPGMDNLAATVARRDAVPANDRVRVDMININVDGGPENGTAVMLAPL